ncbi:hypothetical protein M758_UG330400 [Ceratodon purpureus]|nr:hypothetical protein M758_UG330400 [Ceratodon purpureus]
MNRSFLYNSVVVIPVVWYCSILAHNEGLFSLRHSLHHGRRSIPLNVYGVLFNSLHRQYDTSSSYWSICNLL